MIAGDVKEFEKELKSLIQEMQKINLIPMHTNIQLLMKSVMEKLDEDRLNPQFSISPNDLKNNPAVRKSIGLGCMAEHDALMKNIFDYRMLLKNPGMVSDEELKKQLKNVFTEMLKLKMGGQKLTSEEQQELNEKIDALVDKLTEQFQKDNFNNEILGENDKMYNFLAACIDPVLEQRRELYGVGIPGEVFEPVRGVPIGDQINSPDLASGLGSSYEDVEKKIEKKAPDELGSSLMESEKGVEGVPAILKRHGIVSSAPTLEPH